MNIWLSSSWFVPGCAIVVRGVGRARYVLRILQNIGIRPTRESPCNAFYLCEMRPNKSLCHMSAYSKNWIVHGADAPAICTGPTFLPQWLRIIAGLQIMKKLTQTSMSLLLNCTSSAQAIIDHGPVPSQQCSRLSNSEVYPERSKKGSMTPQLFWHPAGAFIVSSQEDMVLTTSLVPVWVCLLQPML